MTKDDEQTAFPFGDKWPGMTLRDWFAGQCLPGIVGNHVGYSHGQEAEIAATAYRVADAMLAERDKAASHD